MFFFFFKQKTAYEIGVRLVGSEMCIRDSAYTVDFDSEELIQKSIVHIDSELYVSRLQYTVTYAGQKDKLNADMIHLSLIHI